MYIDCHSCPGRAVACDGCMMQVLFGAPNSGNRVAEDGATVTVTGPSDDAVIDAAIDAFVGAAMATSSAAGFARRTKVPVQGRGEGPGLRILRAG